MPEKILRVAHVADEACVVQQTTHIVVTHLRLVLCQCFVIIY